MHHEVRAVVIIRLLAQGALILALDRRAVRRVSHVRHAMGRPQTFKPVRVAAHPLGVDDFGVHGNLYLGLRRNRLHDPLYCVGDGNGIVLAAVAETEGHRACIGVLSTRNEHKGHLAL